MLEMSLGSLRNRAVVQKAGRRVCVEESRALQFAHSLHLPVPAIREVNVSGQNTEIVMEFVHGECLRRLGSR